MEPATIIGITAFGLADRLTKTLNFLLQLTTKFRYANVKITLLIGYLGSINAAICEIANIVKMLSKRAKYEELADSLNTTLKCTKLSLSFLESKIEGLRSGSQDEVSMVDKITMILKDAEFDGYINGISSYVNALNLLLNALQRYLSKSLAPYFLMLGSRSLLEQQGVLKSVEAQGIIEAMKDETSSIFCIVDNRSIMSRQSKASEATAALNISFQFDAEILSSRIYAGAYRSHLRQVIASRKHGDTTPAIAPRESPGAKEGHTGVGLHSSDRRLDSERKKLGSDVLRERQHEYLEDLASVANTKKIASDEISSNSSSNKIAAKPQSQEEPKKPYLQQSKMPISMNSWQKPAQSSPPLHTRPEKNTGGKTWTSPREDLLNRIRQVTASKVKPLEAKKYAELVNSHILEIILLGIHESGKSTLLKAIKLFQEGPWTAEERKSFSKIIFSNVCDGTRSVLEAMEPFEIPLDSDEMEYHVQTIFMQPRYPGPESITPEVHSAIAALAHDRGFQQGLKIRKKYYSSSDNLDL